MQVNMHEAKTNLSSLAERASKGERVIIARAGKPLVELVPVRPERRKIKFGTLKGKIWLADDFYEPDVQLVESFYNSKIVP
jgi:prevent-host-death family protein